MKLYSGNIIGTGSTITYTTLRDGFTGVDIYSNNLFPPIRSSSTTLTIVFDLAVATDFDYIIIAGHNITEDATITLQANATDSWGSPSVSVSPDWTNDHILYEWSTTQTYRYIRLVIDDSSPANPDGYIEISKVQAGEVFEMIAISPDFGNPITFNTTVAETDCGTVYGVPGIEIQSYSVSAWGGKSDKTLFDSIYKDRQNLYTLFVSMYPDDLDIYPLLHARITNNSINWQHGEDGIYRCGFTFKEVK